ncbi:class A beta-lactamase [Streptomyces sp. NPDC048718]|uniref:class A beta-lactamase n=1 Tax=Streptomyces sp. NPDC048718 TaxID=3365587 RepID=UPI003712268A
MQFARARHTVLGALAVLTLLPLTACGEAKPSAEAPPALLSPSASSPSSGATKPAPDVKATDRRFATLEREFDARLGVYAVDTGTGREITHNADERFAYASTFKALVVGAVLREYSLGGLDRKVGYSAGDLVPHSPVTQEHAGTGLSLRELCDAAIRLGDNTAANLLVGELGGPKALNAALKKVGDDTTRVERLEPDLNQWSPGATRDTSTPRRLAEDLRGFALGDLLGEGERTQLAAWLRAGTTGTGLIRAGMPKGWVVGDRSGAGLTYGTRNDIAVVWPPGGAPVVMAILSHRRTDTGYDDRLIAKAASVVADELS